MIWLSVLLVFIESSFIRIRSTRSFNSIIRYKRLKINEFKSFIISQPAIMIVPEYIILVSILFKEINVFFQFSCLLYLIYKVASLFIYYLLYLILLFLLHNFGMFYKLYWLSLISNWLICLLLFGIGLWIFLLDFRFWYLDELWVSIVYLFVILF